MVLIVAKCNVNEHKVTDVVTYEVSINSSKV